MNPTLRSTNPASQRKPTRSGRSRLTLCYSDRPASYGCAPSPPTDPATIALRPPVDQGPKCAPDNLRPAKGSREQSSTPRGAPDRFTSLRCHLYHNQIVKERQDRRQNGRRPCCQIDRGHSPHKTPRGGRSPSPVGLYSAPPMYQLFGMISNRPVPVKRQ